MVYPYSKNTYYPKNGYEIVLATIGYRSRNHKQAGLATYDTSAQVSQVARSKGSPLAEHGSLYPAPPKIKLEHKLAGLAQRAARPGLLPF